MNILILGYGKMGRSIEKIAIDRGHKIVEIVDLENRDKLESLGPDKIDVAIEFSQPDAAFENIKKCMTKGIKVVSGTTGWLDKKQVIVDLCVKNKGAFFYASNYSIGVNLFFQLNQALARLMKDYPQYLPEMTEIHHTEKKDAPSGTAITLAEDLIEENPEILSWENKKVKDRSKLSIESLREGGVPGTHSIRYISDIDQIEITHEAFGREGFALGAVMVAEWIKNQSGVLGMNDFLKI